MLTTPDHAPDRTLAGIGYMVLFAVFAPLLDMFAKMASAEATPTQIAFARFAMQAALMAPLLAMGAGLRWPARGEWAIHAARGALLAGSTVFFFVGLAAMPMAETIAIFFVEPLILTLLSVPLLGERVGWRRLLACAVGFGGALLVIQPNFAAFGWTAAAPLGAAVLFALYLILTRRHALRSDALTMQFWSGLTGAATLAAVMPFGVLAGSPALGATAFGGWTLALMLGVGVVGALAHLAIAAAFARTPASTLAPFQYLEIVTATLAGWLAFGDLPGGTTLAGVAIIVGSGLVIFQREKRDADVRAARR